MSAAAKSLALAGATEAADRRRRIVAIVGASSGNLVEWYDFYAYAFTSIYFASAFFPSGDTTSQLARHRRNFRRRLFHAAARRLAVRLDRRHAWPQNLDDHLGADDVRRIAHDRLDADLRDHRRRLRRSLLLIARLVQGLSVGGEYGTAATYMSEVALERKSRLLLLVPVRDADRRAAAGPAGACCPAEPADRPTSSRPGAGAFRS